MTSASFELVVTTVALALSTSSSRVMSAGLSFLDSGMDRNRNVVIRTGERGRAVI